MSHLVLNIININHYLSPVSQTLKHLSTLEREAQNQSAYETKGFANKTFTTEHLQFDFQVFKGGAHFLNFKDILCLV